MSRAAISLGRWGNWRRMRFDCLNYPSTSTITKFNTGGPSTQHTNFWIKRDSLAEKVDSIINTFMEKQQLAYKLLILRYEQEVSVKYILKSLNISYHHYKQLLKTVLETLDVFL